MILEHWFSLPRRLLAILKGESLLNDALALVLYETAVHVTQIKAYVWGSVSIKFCVAASGGIVIGLAVGWLMFRIRRLASDRLVGSYRWFADRLRRLPAGQRTARIRSLIGCRSWSLSQLERT